MTRIYKPKGTDTLLFVNGKAVQLMDNNFESKENLTTKENQDLKNYLKAGKK